MLGETHNDLSVTASSPGDESQEYGQRELLESEHELLIGDESNPGNENTPARLSSINLRSVDRKMREYYSRERSTKFLSRILNILSIQTTRPSNITHQASNGSWSLFPNKQRDHLDVMNEPSYENIREVNDHSSYFYRADNNPNENHPKMHNTKYRGSFFVRTFVFLLLLISFILILFQLTDLISRHQKLVSQLSSSLNGRKINSTTSKVFEDKGRLMPTASDSHWLVSTGKCHIPDIDPWHESVKDYFIVGKPLDCASLSDKGKALSYVKENKLFFVEEALRANILRDGNCCYREVKRSDSNDDDLEWMPNCQLITESGINIPFEIIKVECNQTDKFLGSVSRSDQSSEKLNQTTAYSNVHAFIVPKPEETQVLAKAMAENLDPEEYYNVVMVGVDTMSRLNGHRQLSGTLKTLKEKYKALEFFGYNKVGENTFPNIVPLLTGLRPTQLVETKCWLSNNYTDESESGDDYLNNCKYLWNYFQQFGYMTYYSEDWPQASTFNYLKPGFDREPTAYYGRPVTLARRDHLTGEKDRMGCDICVLDKPIVPLDLQHLESYLSLYRNNPHFAFHWINCPQHNELNGGSKIDGFLNQFFQSIHSFTQAERSFVIFFSDHGWRWNDFVSTHVGHYESSLPMMMIAPPRRFIERHPDLYENLKNHTKTLFTPFDMFKTLLAVRNLGARGSAGGKLANIHSNDKSAILGKRNIAAVTESNSTAVFTQVPPIYGDNYVQSFKTISLIDRLNLQEVNRSCLDAGIPDNYCACNEFKEADVNSLEVLAAAYYMVYVHLDSTVLQGEKICTRLNLDRVDRAEIFEASRVTKRSRRAAVKQPLKTSTTATPTIISRKGEPIITQSESVVNETVYLPNKEYNIIVVTNPGGGIFQEVIRSYGNDTSGCEHMASSIRNLIKKDETVAKKREAVMKMNEVCKLSIHSDSISRLNLYKDQSKCVKKNSELNKVCYCKDLLPK